MQNRTILIIDDDAIDRMFLISSIKENLGDVEIIEVEQSDKAFERFVDIRPMVTILDIRMPSPNGFDVLERIKTDKRYANERVVMLSSSTSPLDKLRAKELGADGYRVKPSCVGGYNALVKNIAEIYC